MCRIASLFLLQRLKASTSGDAPDFNIETRAVIKFFFPARQGAEGNSRHSDRNIRGTCTIVCHIYLPLHAGWRGSGWNIVSRPIEPVCQRNAYAFSPRRVGSLHRGHGYHSHDLSASAARQLP